MPPANRPQPKRARSSTSEYTLPQFQREFPDDAACLEHLWRARHSPDGEHAHCPKCGSERVFKRYATKQGRQSWTCTGCGHHVHPTAGTIFHKSSTSLHRRPYRPLAREYAGHRVINHPAGCYVQGDIYTNTIEGFFSNLKTGMRGTYKLASRKWLQSYLDEYAWRYNHRQEPRGMFFSMLDNAARTGR